MSLRCYFIVIFSVWHLSLKPDKISHYLLVKRLVRSRNTCYLFCFTICYCKQNNCVSYGGYLSWTKKNQNKTECSPKLITYLPNFPPMMFEIYRHLSRIMTILWSKWKMMTAEDARASVTLPTLSVVWCMLTVFSFKCR